MRKLTMKENESKNKNSFDQLFNKMLHDTHVSEMAIGYLHDEKKVSKATIYNELLSKKQIGYSPERKKAKNTGMKAAILTQGFSAFRGVSGTWSLPMVYLTS
jgi:hypothetical protein